MHSEKNISRTPFRFKRFSVRNSASALKVGTDAVVLGACMTVLPDDRKALDIGTGTGVIALMAAQRLENAGAEFSIAAIDIDLLSVGEASLNFSGSPWASRLEARHCALDEFRPDGPLSLIFSNPPFYDNSLPNPDARESTARHTGSLSYREICAFAGEHLAPGGRLSLILPAEEEKALVRTAASFGLGLFRIVRIRTSGRKPFRRIVAEFLKGKPGSALLEEELVLQDGTRRTERYAALTEDFYL